MILWSLSSYLRALYLLDISPLLDVVLVKIFSQIVSCCFVLLTLSFALQNFYNFMKSYFQFLILENTLLVFCSGNFPLWSCFWGSSPLSFLLVSVYLVLYGGPWSTWIWALYKEIRMDWFAFFYMLITSWNSTICWKCCLFSTGWF